MLAVHCKRLNRVQVGMAGSFGSATPLASALLLRLPNDPVFFELARADSGPLGLPASNMLGHGGATSTSFQNNSSIWFRSKCLKPIEKLLSPVLRYILQ